MFYKTFQKFYVINKNIFKYNNGSLIVLIDKQKSNSDNSSQNCCKLTDFIELCGVRLENRKFLRTPGL